MIHQLRNRHLYLLLAADVTVFAGALWLAHMVRFAGIVPDRVQNQIPELLLVILPLKALTFFLLGAYRGMWRYTSLADMGRVVAAGLLSSLLLIAGITIWNRFAGLSRFAFLADSLFTIVGCASIRAGIRLYYELGRRASTAQERPVRRILVVGAGDAAAAIIRELQGAPASDLQPVVCLDDDPMKSGRALQGIPIRGPIAHLPEIAQRYRVQEILIVMPSASGARMREIIEICRRSSLPFRTVPSLASLVDGRVTVNDLRPVRLEDLLRREPVQLDTARIGAFLTGSRVLVTGAGGSIGSELCRQILHFHPAALVLVDSCEFNLYQIDTELRPRRGETQLVPVMGRIQDRALMQHVFHRHLPQVVFHAAACKHVPMVELNPWEAIFNNVLGSSILMDSAEDVGVERFVQISTDKAVRPTNVMGASKRMAEILLQSRHASHTRFMAVRFGNVMGSSGSVIPRFQAQILAGGPVTVTHPEVTRYFMTIPEACQLILQAGSMGQGGEIFILKMGQPVRIADMARDLIVMSGKEVGTDIQIAFTGLRPGEKLYEELITQGEGIVPTPHGKIMVLQRISSGLPPDLAASQAQSGLAELLAAAQHYDSARIRQTLHRIIPEYQASATNSVLCPSFHEPDTAHAVPATMAAPSEACS